MSGWVKGPGGIFKRRQGLYVRQASAAPPAAVTLRPTFASMTFAAAYDADFPGVLALGGTFNPASAGPDVTLSGGDLTATFTGTASVLTTNTIPTGVLNNDRWCWELLFSAGNWDAAGSFSAAVGPYDGAAFMGSQAANGMRYNSDGTIVGYLPVSGPGPALAPGDILGFVQGDFLSGDSAQVYFYLNGVAVGSGYADPTGAVTEFSPIVTRA